MSKSIPSGAFLLILIFLIVSLGLTIFYYRKYHQLISNDSTIQARAITKHLEGTILLPNEDPTIAQVADKNKLGNPLLSQEAENGDQILIFSKSKRAILYRPSVKKVIDMYPLSSN